MQLRNSVVFDSQKPYIKNHRLDSFEFVILNMSLPFFTLVLVMALLVLASPITLFEPLAPTFGSFKFKSILLLVLFLDMALLTALLTPPFPAKVLLFLLSFVAVSFVCWTCARVNSASKCSFRETLSTSFAFCKYHHDNDKRSAASHAKYNAQ